VVLGRGCRGGRRVPRPLKEVRLRTLSRPAAARAVGAVRIGHEFEPGRSRDRATPLARVESGFAPSGGSTPGAYRRYLTTATCEFTAIKGVDVAWRTGWLSDRAAAFLATGRPVITEDTGAARFLPPESGFRFVSDLESAEAAVEEVMARGRPLSRQARDCAVEVFDSAKNLRKILGL
jgi:hypothetical protein